MPGTDKSAAEPQLSIVIPVYNEQGTLCQIVTRVQEALADLSYEIVLVDDGSTDGTGEIIERMASQLSLAEVKTPHLTSPRGTGERDKTEVQADWVPDYSGMTNMRVFSHVTNRGKGAALRTGFAACRARIVVVQDADLEYDPRDITRLVQPIVEGKADVVIGSRFHADVQRVHLFWHWVGNALLTLLSNLFTNLNLSDMECGYKAFRREVLDSFTIQEDRFGVEPELMAKVARGGWRVFEVPVSYAGRDYAEGKKIGLKDALRAVWCIVRYGVGALRVSRRELRDE